MGKGLQRSFKKKDLFIHSKSYRNEFPLTNSPSSDCNVWGWAKTKPGQKTGARNISWVSQVGGPASAAFQVHWKVDWKWSRWNVAQHQEQDAVRSQELYIRNQKEKHFVLYQTYLSTVSPFKASLCVVSSLSVYWTLPGSTKCVPHAPSLTCNKGERITSPLQPIRQPCSQVQQQISRVFNDRVLQEERTTPLQYIQDFLTQ